MLIDIEGTDAVNPKDLIGNLMHLPLARGGVLVRALEPKKPAYERTHEVEIPILIHVVQDAVDASALQFRIFGTGVGKELFLFIIGPEVKEDLAVRGK